MLILLLTALTVNTTADEFIEKPFDVNDTMQIYYEENYSKTLTDNAAGVILLGAIRFYQTIISPAQGEVCNFSPSCSNYMFKAIRLSGPLGILRGIDRLQRCNYSAREYMYLYYGDMVLTKTRGYKIVDNP